MIYDTSKIFVNSIGRKFNLSGISTGPLALFTMSDITILFIFFLEAGRYLKLKDSGRTFFYGCNTWMTFVKFNDFFTVALS